MLSNHWHKTGKHKRALHHRSTEPPIRPTNDHKTKQANFQLILTRSTKAKTGNGHGPWPKRQRRQKYERPGQKNQTSATMNPNPCPCPCPYPCTRTRIQIQIPKSRVRVRVEPISNFLTHFKFQLAINVMQSNTLNHLPSRPNNNTPPPISQQQPDMAIGIG